MLVLSRKRGEEIYITLEDGRRIVLTVLECNRDAVRLGFVAPKTIAVHRREVSERGVGPAPPPPDDEGDIPCTFKKEGE